jgi:hypothetical protein
MKSSVWWRTCTGKALNRLRFQSSRPCIPAASGRAGLLVRARGRSTTTTTAVRAIVTQTFPGAVVPRVARRRARRRALDVRRADHRPRNLCGGEHYARGGCARRLLRPARRSARRDVLTVLRLD